MAGTNADFSASEFRSGIKTAMAMAKPGQVPMQTTWRWARKETYTQPHDPAGKPYNWNAPTATDPHIADLVVDCAVAGVHGAEEETVLGGFLGGKVEITLLDVDYDAILARGGGRFPDFVLVSGDVYEVTDNPDVIGLFNVNVWTVHALAQTRT